ncbi:MAG: 4Fe-4S single cluster domain-containing protein [Sedimentisphaerales bacterium]
MSNILLNTADIRHRSEVNGPGLRSVVWVQGCQRKCPGCINPHTHEHKIVKLLDPKELAQIKNTIGITISGGEPFEQAAGCAILAETVKKYGKSVMVFSGFPYEQLKDSTVPEVKSFLYSIDILVAGPYIQELKCESRLWRASSNQTVHFLNSYIRPENIDNEDDPVIEISTDGQIMSYTGFPELEDLTLFDHMATKKSKCVSACL